MDIKVVFERSNGELKELAIAETAKAANRVINNFLKAHNFTSYYTRISFYDDFIEYDVGSYTEFFRLYCDDTDWLRGNIFGR